MQTTTKQQTATSKKLWGPAWLHTKSSDGPIERQRAKGSPPAKPSVASTPQDPFEYSEWCWSQLPQLDYEYLTGPRCWPSPCAWCGGRIRHSPACEELKDSWEPAMPFGKHKGKPVSEVPADYLDWMLTSQRLDAELRAAVEGRLKQGG